jgi:hypothetical protein
MNFDKLCQGMAQCQSKHQCYFIDACSNIPVDGFTVSELGDQPFLRAELNHPNKQALTLMASQPGERASAEVGKVSIFTEALVLCLDGLGSAPDMNGTWVVTDTLLVDRVVRLVNQMSKESQVPNTNITMPPTQLHICKGPPLIPITVSSSPQDALSKAVPTLTSDSNPTWHGEPVLTLQNEWHFDKVEAGLYRLTAHFPQGEYQEVVDKLLWIEPPGPWPLTGPIQCKEKSQ